MDITAEKVIEAFVTLRDQKEALAKRHKEEMAPINENMTKCQAWLHQRLLADNLQNFSSPLAVAFFKEHTEVKVQDWNAVLGHIQETNTWDLLERRISKTAYVDYKAAGQDIPGVTYTTEKVVHVQRK